MSLHPTLARQIRKAFGENPPAGFDDFLTAVSRTYEGFDQDRQLIERSLEVSSQELGDRIKQLRAAQADLQAEKTSIEHTVQDRTHELVAAQAELQASIRALPFGFAMINLGHEIVFHNHSLEELVGFEIPAEAPQTPAYYRKLVDYFAPAVNLVEQVDLVLNDRSRFEREISLGASFYRLIILPILAPQTEELPVLGAVLLLENITDAKAQERSRDEFFSIASHELRTPLTAIKGNTAMIMEYYAEAVKDPDLHQMVEDMHESSIRLIDIVNDFLSASRLEQGRMTFRNIPMSLRDLVTDVVGEYDTIAAKANLKLEWAPDATNPAMVLGDSDRVRQIVINLISNALKFTSEGGVSFQIFTRDNVTQLNVTDTGRGIPVESQHLLFRKFQQATNNILTRDTTKGTGLGLYISQLMAENMAGRLFLGHTELSKGSTFVLELPSAPANK